MSEARIAIAFVVREKFGWALPALQRIKRYVSQSAKIYIVDCGYPDQVRLQIRRELEGRKLVEWIHVPRYVYPNEALNLVVEKLKEQYLCLVQNDVLIEPRFMDEMLLTFERRQADIVWPMTYEIHDGKRDAHRDEYTDMDMGEAEDGTFKVQQPRESADEELPDERRIHHFEMHCVMFTAQAARALGPLPPLNSREHIDCAVNAYHQGMRVFANERALANYVLPPIFDYDADFFAFRWDVAHADWSHRQVARRWNLRPMPSAMGFVKQHARYARPENRLPDPSAGSALDLHLSALDPAHT